MLHTALRRWNSKRGRSEAWGGEKVAAPAPAGVRRLEAVRAMMQKLESRGGGGAAEMRRIRQRQGGKVGSGGDGVQRVPVGGRHGG